MRIVAGQFRFMHQRPLDAAVAAAYGWSADISDDEALRGWLALNSGARGSLGH